MAASGICRLLAFFLRLRDRSRLLSSLPARSCARRRWSSSGIRDSRGLLTLHITRLSPKRPPRVVVPARPGELGSPTMPPVVALLALRGRAHYPYTARCGSDPFTRCWPAPSRRPASTRSCAGRRRACIGVWSGATAPLHTSEQPSTLRLELESRAARWATTSRRRSCAAARGVSRGVQIASTIRCTEARSPRTGGALSRVHACQY
jgi:hypothetical protein